MISAVAVVVPAANEERRVARCLASIRRAVARVEASGTPCLVVLALDGCTDATAAEAARADPRAGLVRLAGRCVGRARAAATAHALGRLAETATSRIWIASTDADGVVPGDWLERQLAHAALGAEAVAGGVIVEDWAERSPEVRRRFELYRRAKAGDAGATEVHGANLGFTAAAYRRAGGWPEERTGEDVLLWERLLRSDVRCEHAEDVLVWTSARREARAPLGFGALLDALADRPDGAADPTDDNGDRWEAATL